MNKKILVGLLSFILLFNLCGCLAIEVIPEDTKTTRLDVSSGKSVSFEHEKEGFKFRTTYSITDAEDNLITSWAITESKFITYELELVTPTDAIVQVEHVHCDMAIKSTMAQLNERSQDSMDDYYHGNLQDGFSINNNHSYSEIFAVEGFSDQIFEIWGTYNGAYGAVSGGTKKLTEENLRSEGVYGSQLSMVYNIIIKYPNEDSFFTIPIKDKLIIPVDPNWKARYINENGEAVDKNGEKLPE